ncbi:bifunctional diaminohydroxyphosphoribosylaminopyrimidine deaminase/5-amino-6-(5-phosphoribosylamino)uracil reductase RibD [Streptococcus ratti]|uniref:Riboflavin biosynthesis protein RibD n=1 Tax=Streptococcus ratti FA-1 = DSM 20564 TaxID=699248 RepID=A0ABN0GWY5_STRRT|nr:bifunctional diaminohydroxyphosphoribosylaminopyrimidine deaminase/5-amino-6-(5-phosphoribosylamino)uracil reductase RibD [Streptococcus ratti]EJN94299.1 diaminohydroxyphosphoribosylaminopyrimidine deaminase / 5-amino-6-(5-phosphoribosylamino)uracil reductase [Streptococcus ratti FA-1 = DSM 20564]EMP70925.1 riboflavin-specific deaminase [Streptococcus ratti FA-1 = DSM 20564]QEY06252.1 bifunctional diaminohydroxyphosphoribosylaminopyrimidine deaminase/5-amino-6-(5-phosphoribosylamino)uracil re
MDKTFMALAIEEAKKGFKQTYTNPLVGAVIVKDNQVIACGAHLKYGDYHAERNAIETCSTPEELQGATLYVTLEPCHHTGKQPPCTQAIIEAGIKRVVIAQLDPNPMVSGKGKQFLESQGVSVEVGLLGEEARALNPYYNHFYQEERPYIVLKSAMSLDGKIALKGERTQLTGSVANQFIHEERDCFQAILVGSETVLVDNPSLLGKNSSLYPPIRIVLDRRGRIFAKKDLHIFTDDKAPVYIFSQQEVADLPSHVTVFTAEQWTVSEVVARLVQEGIQSLYVEGGSCIHDAFYEADLWDEWLLYLSPTLLGGDALPDMSSLRPSRSVKYLSDLSLSQIGQDWRISAKKGR